VGAAPVFASGHSNVVRPDDRRLAYEGRWGGTAEAATIEPTRTRIYTLAQNPEYRLGWTVRGYLQSTYTDYYLGAETRRVPKPAITPTRRTATEGDTSHDDHS
jgi:hypothetical protein